MDWRDYVCLYREKNIFDIDWNSEGVKYKDVFQQSEREFSAYNFEHADTKILLSNFETTEQECKSLLKKS